MLHLHWQKTIGRLIILTLISVSASLHAAAQKVLYLEDHDSKPYYFGITLSAAQARFSATGYRDGSTACQIGRLCPGTAGHCKAVATL